MAFADQTKGAPGTQPVAPKPVSPETVPNYGGFAGEGAKPQAAKTEQVQTGQVPPKPTLPPAATDFKDLQDQALKGGLSQQQLDEAVKTYTTSPFYNAQDFEAYLKKFAQPQGAAKDTLSTIVSEGGDQSQVDKTSDLVPNYDIAKTEEKANTAFDEYSKVKGELGTAYKAEQDQLVQSANDLYATQVQNLDNLQALQQELAAKQAALTESSAAIQKQEIQNAYEANQAAIEFQKKKVAEAYQAMQEEQDLLNKQNKIKQETAMGLIYGGFGSVAANKNIEDTVMKGEKALMGLKKDAENMDTELQMEIVNLNKAYSLDLNKVEQWKAEQMNTIYSELQSYLVDITNDKNMAATEKKNATAAAITAYNTKMAEINASVAQTKYDLALSLIDKAEEYKQMNFENSIALKDAQQGEEEFAMKKEEFAYNKAANTFSTMMSAYSAANYAGLPDAVKKQMDDLAAQMNMPAGFAEQAITSMQEAAKAEQFVSKEFTDNNGNVTVVTYNPFTGEASFLPLGSIAKAVTGKGFSMEYNSATGNVEPFNKDTGQFAGTDVLGAFGVGSIGGWCGVYASKISDAGPVGNTWGEKKQKIDPTITTPSVGDKLLMPLGVATDGSGYGHVAVVLGYDPATGMIQVVESNKNGEKKTDGDGKGTVTMGAYNINEVLSGGGGFMSGNLYPQYAQVLGGAGGTAGAQGAQSPQGVQKYIELAEKIGTKAALAQLKDEISNDKMQADYVKKFNDAVGQGYQTEGVKGADAPAWVQEMLPEGVLDKTVFPGATAQEFSEDAPVTAEDVTEQLLADFTTLKKFAEGLGGFKEAEAKSKIALQMKANFGVTLSKAQLNQIYAAMSEYE